MISVIIPAFNAEKFIQRAIDSVLAQTYKDWELIIVDDGSTDNTRRDCNFYTDSRISIYIHGHKGVGAARNAGMIMARGELIFFLDADDYLMPNALELLHEGYKETGAQMVVGGVFRQAPDGRISKITPPINMGFERLLLLDGPAITDAIWDYLKTSDSYLVSHCWGRLYEREFIEKNRIRFNNMKIGEDGCFNIGCLTFAKNVLVVNEPLYCFQMHKASSTLLSIDDLDLEPLKRNLSLYFLRNLFVSATVEGTVNSFIVRLAKETIAYSKKEVPKMTSYRLQTPKDLLLARIKESKLPVVIYGADTVGKVIMDILLANGIEVAFFTDYDPKKHEFRGRPVERPGHWTCVDTDTDCLTIISVMSIGNVVKGLKNWVAGAALLADIDTTQIRLFNPLAQRPKYDYLIGEEDYQIESVKIAHAAYLKKDYTFLRSLDVMITERCSLKCRDCSNLMQYFEKPQDFDVAEVLKDVDNLLQNVDEILEARVLGGDAFMHPEWPEVVAHLVKSDKIRRVVVYTNGVILPKDKGFCNSLCNSKVIVTITDYGKLSKNLERLVMQLRKHGVWHKVVKPDVWIDCASIKKHNRTQEENNKLFQNCVGNNLTTLVKGKLFRCPYAASLYLLGISDDAGACDYCTSRILTNTIKPAIQTRRPLKYEST